MAGAPARGAVRTLPFMEGTVSGLILVAAFAMVTVLAVFLAARLLRATRGDGSHGSSDA
jgi:hypothetical protein